MGFFADSNNSVISVIGAVCTAIVCLSYLLTLRKQHAQLQSHNFRLYVLCSRAAFSMLFYAVLIFASLLVPRAFPVLLIPIDVVEGYTFYCFFVILVTNMGGPEHSLQILLASNRQLLLSCSFSKDKRKFYSQVQWALFHFMTTRIVIVILEDVLSSMRLVVVILQIVAILIVTRAFVALVLFFENVYLQNSNINGVSKLVVLKLSVACIVIQSFIAQLCVSLNAVHLPANNTYSSDELLIRLLCK